MPENQRRVYPPAGDGEVTQASSENGVIRRRDFIRTGASGLAGAALAAAGCNRVSENQNARPLGNLRSATPAELQGLVGDGRRRRILLRGGVVLTLDARLGDFEKAEYFLDQSLTIDRRNCAQHFHLRRRDRRLLGHYRHARVCYDAPSHVRDAAAQHDPGWTPAGRLAAGKL